MAPTTYMIARALGAPFIALPIFLMRRFHHGGFVVRPDAGIKVPKDLGGKKVGVRAYSVTTGVWTRGIFINEYGLDSAKVTWVVDTATCWSALALVTDALVTRAAASHVARYPWPVASASAASWSAESWTFAMRLNASTRTRKLRRSRGRTVCVRHATNQRKCADKKSSRLCAITATA
jgi:hypothetical protein